MRWIKLPQIYLEDEQRVARLLNLVLLTIFIAAFIYVLTTAFFYSFEPRILATILLIQLIILVARYLLGRGHLNAAIRLLLGGLWLTLTYIFYIQGGLKHPAFSAYLLVIIMTALLLTPRATIVVWSTTILASVTFLILGEAGLLPEPAFTHSLFMRWILFIILMSVATVLLYIATHTVARIINRLHTYQQELIERKNQLIQEVESHKRAKSEILSLARKNQEIAKRFEALFNQSNDAVFILDLDGNYLSANQRACELFGYTFEELVSFSFQDIVHPKEVDHSINIREKLVNGQQIAPYERRFRKKDGTIVHCELNVELVRDMDGNPLHIQSICRDISERKRMADETLSATLMQARVNLLSNVITAVSHDFRTPLSSIQTNLYLIQKDQDPDRHATYLHRITDQTQVLSRMVENLLTLIKLDHDYELDLSPLNLQQFIPSMIEGRLSTSDDQHRLTFAIEDDIPVIKCDPKLLHESINHLIDNAIYHSGTDEPIHVNVGCRDEHIVIDVCDKGVGIESDQVQYIFESFYRTDPSRSISLTKGNGLGLPIVKRIIELHGGHVEVESRPGEGSTFRLFIPVEAESENQ